MGTILDLIFKILLIPIGAVALYCACRCYLDNTKERQEGDRTNLYTGEPIPVSWDQKRDAFWDGVKLFFWVFVGLGGFVGLLFKGISYLFGIPFLEK